MTFFFLLTRISVEEVGQVVAGKLILSKKCVKYHCTRLIVMFGRG